MNEWFVIEARCHEVWTHHMIQLLATTVAVLIPMWIIVRANCRELGKLIIELIDELKKKGGEVK